MATNRDELPKAVTNREHFLAGIAGTESLDKLPNAVTNEEKYLDYIARNGGGSGGDVTKAYVDAQITSVRDDIGDISEVIPETATEQNQLATAADIPTNTSDLTNDSDFADKDYVDQQDAAVRSASAVTTTSTTSPLSTANGKPRAIIIYGKSEIVDGEIKSAGEGYAVVDLGTLNWTRSTSYTNAFYYTSITGIKGNGNGITARFTKIANKHAANFGRDANDNEYCFNLDSTSEQIFIRCDTYTDATAFKTAMSGVLLCYQFADPTQGNTIAIKTDDGTGINGTMATFTTGTPLYGVSDTVRDVMEWDGSSGKVTKNCGDVVATSLTWQKGNRNNDDTGFNYYAYLSANPYMKAFTHFIMPNYTSVIYDSSGWENIAVNTGFIIPSYIVICSASNDTTELATELANKHIIYELATPTTQPLTQTENESLSALKTYSPQTIITINDSPDYSIETYANTDNGKAVADVQEEITRFASIIIGVPENHRNIFRGKNLGDYVTSAQENAIVDGSFDDLYTGDYWTINGVNWRVADMDYMLGCGDTPLTAHHLVIVPDSGLLSAPMNDTDTTEGGYVYSHMRYNQDGGIPQASRIIVEAFPGFVLPHREFLTNAVTSGKPSGLGWYGSTVELMSESMLYGHREYSAMSDGSAFSANSELGKSQLALFAIAPKFITIRAPYWLRDIVDGNKFTEMNETGVSYLADAHASIYVRPYFLMGKSE